MFHEIFFTHIKRECHRIFEECWWQTYSINYIFVCRIKVTWHKNLRLCFKYMSFISIYLKIAKFQIIFFCTVIGLFEVLSSTMVQIMPFHYQETSQLWVWGGKANDIGDNNCSWHLVMHYTNCTLMLNDPIIFTGGRRGRVELNLELKPEYL